MTNKGLSILLLYRRSRQGDVHRGNRHWCLKMGKVDVVRQVQYSPSKLNKTEPVVSPVHPNKKKDQDNCPISLSLSLCVFLVG